MTLWLIFGMHMFICILVYILMKKRIFHTGSLIMLMVVLIPFWGVCALLIEERIIRRKKMGTKTVGVEKLNLRDQKYRRIEVEKTENKTVTVPLEEAMLINDAKTRRSLMLDILHKNPNEYVHMLKRVSLSDDTELTHYATTTIMEIQSDFEKQIRKSYLQLKKCPEDREILDAYINLLQNYIDSGLISGNILFIQRSKLKKALEKALEGSPHEKRIYLLFIENELAAGQYAGIEGMLKTAKARWPEEEKIYMLYLNYYRNSGKGAEIRQLFKEIQENKIYLSRKGKEWFGFWNAEVN